jgi:hypothetical protein
MTKVFHVRFPFYMRTNRINNTIIFVEKCFHVITWLYIVGIHYIYTVWANRMTIEWSLEKMGHTVRSLQDF